MYQEEFKKNIGKQFVWKGRNVTIVSYFEVNNESYYQYYFDDEKSIKQINVSTGEEGLSFLFVANQYQEDRFYFVDDAPQEYIVPKEKLIDRIELFLTKRGKLGYSLIIIFLIIGSIFVFKYDDIKLAYLDYYTAHNYKATKQMEKIQQALNLTSEGTFLFKASNPRLENAEIFNIKCDSHNQNISILGCYINREIHIYDMEDGLFEGIKESTIAHELLHAAWERMSLTERLTIIEYLDQVFANPKYRSDLMNELAHYDYSNWYDELHSRVATEIRDIPIELEQHYQQYFNDRLKIVEYYENYWEPFYQNIVKRNELFDEIAILEQQIKQSEEHYNDILKELDKSMNAYTECIKNADCSLDNEKVTTYQQNLNQFIQQANSQYELIDNLYLQINEKRDEYNNLIIEGQEMDDMINSNAKSNY